MQIHFDSLLLRQAAFQLEIDGHWQAPVLKVTGQTGQGKTLFLRLLAGLEKPLQGQLSFDGQVVSSARHLLPPYRRPISYCFQDYRLFPHLNVLDNLCFGGASKPQALALLTEVEMAHLQTRQIAYLSGGEQQRLAILRALLKPCRLLLLDEPLSALDQTTREQWQQFLFDFQQRQQLSLVYVSHQSDELKLWSDAPECRLEQGQARFLA